MYLPLAYQAQWLPGVLRPRTQFQGGLRDWLRGSGWTPAEKITSKKAAIFVHDSANFADSCANDFIALSTAAFESAGSVPARPAADPKACAWQVISYYYSAYFSANALMRLAGYACTNFDVDVCTDFNELASLCEMGGVAEKEKLRPGVFLVSPAPGGVQKVLVQSLSGVTGGVHVQFWAGFLRFLEAIEKDISVGPLPTADKKVVKQEIRALRETLTLSSKTNGSWLSEVRNAVNYRLSDGVWFPYLGAGVTSDELRAALRAGLQNRSALQPATSLQPNCLRLTQVSAWLLSWTKDSLEALDVHARYGKRSLIRDGALAFGASL